MTSSIKKKMAAHTTPGETCVDCRGSIAISAEDLEEVSHLNSIDKQLDELAKLARLGAMQKCNGCNVGKPTVEWDETSATGRIDCQGGTDAVVADHHDDDDVFI